MSSTKTTILNLSAETKFLAGLLKHPGFSKEDWTYFLTTVIGVSQGFAAILISSMFVIEEGNRLFISADVVNEILLQANRFQVLQDPNFLQVIFSRSWLGPRELLGDFFVAN